MFIVRTAEYRLCSIILWLGVGSAEKVDATIQAMIKRRENLLEVGLSS